MFLLEKDTCYINFKGQIVQIFNFEQPGVLKGFTLEDRETYLFSIFGIHVTIKEMIDKEQKSFIIEIPEEPRLTNIYYKLELKLGYNCLCSNGKTYTVVHQENPNVFRAFEKLETGDLNFNNKIMISRKNNLSFIVQIYKEGEYVFPSYEVIKILNHPELS